MKRLHRWISLLVLTPLCFVLLGCNTFRGVGQDIEGAGQAVQKAAEKTKEAIK